MFTIIMEDAQSKGKGSLVNENLRANLLTPAGPWW